MAAGGGGVACRRRLSKSLMIAGDQRTESTCHRDVAYSPSWIYDPCFCAFFCLLTQAAKRVSRTESRASRWPRTASHSHPVCPSGCPLHQVALSRSHPGTPETGPSPAPAVPTAPQRPDTPLGFVQTGPGGGRVSVPQPNRWDFRQVTRRNQLTERAKETCEQ